MGIQRQGDVRTLLGLMQQVIEQPRYRIVAGLAREHVGVSQLESGRAEQER